MAEAPKLPTLPCDVLIAAMCGSGLKYTIAAEVFDLVMGEIINAALAQAAREQRERDAAICVAVADRHVALCRAGRISDIQGLAFGPDACAAAILAQPDPQADGAKEGRG